MTLEIEVRQTLAVDGTDLFDLVVKSVAGASHVIYRGIDRAHVEDVAADLRAGRLDPMAVQTVFRETVLARSGGPRSVFVRGLPIPLPLRKGKAADCWDEARSRIAALRGA